MAVYALEKLPWFVGRVPRILALITVRKSFVSKLKHRQNSCPRFEGNNYVFNGPGQLKAR
jgi:hypothetical protein